MRYGILFLLSALPAAATAQGPVDARNWTTHPQIRAVRAIYERTERQIAAKGLVATVRHVEFCENGQDTDRQLYADSAGHVLKYATQGGSEDSAGETAYYYSDGRLRFVFAHSADVHGGRMEHRIYFDSTGARIWEHHSTRRGRPDDAEWDEEQLVRAPREAFAEKMACDDGQEEQTPPR